MKFPAWMNIRFPLGRIFAVIVMGIAIHGLFVHAIPSMIAWCLLLLSAAVFYIAIEKVNK